MKNIVLSVLLSLCAFAAWAQPVNHFRRSGHHINFVEQLAAKSNYHYRLSSFRTSDSYQFNYFSYNAQNQLVAIWDTVSNDYSVVDSLFYDQQGHMVRMSGWQLLQGRWENVYYIDYTYDQAGNIATRTNYNNFDGSWELGGVYQYTYNSDNQIVLSVLTMAGMQFQKVEYAYEAGLLKEELWYGYDGSGLSPNEKLIYTYNADGKLIRIDDSTDDGSGVWQYYGRHNYAYDNAGNCVEHHYYDNTGMEAERNEYEFVEDRTLSETLMPWTPEMTRPETYTNVGVYDIEHWYSVDVDHVLHYVCDFIYYYDGSGNAIEEVGTPGLQLSPNPASATVAIDGLSDSPAQAKLIDMTGRVVMTATVSGASNKINVESLPAGCYTLLVSQQGQLRTAKLMVE